MSISKDGYETRKFSEYLDNYFKKQKAEVTREKIFKQFPTSKIGLIDYQTKTIIDYRDKNQHLRQNEKPKFISNSKGD